MKPEQARALVAETFLQIFDRTRFRDFAINLLNHIDKSKAQSWNITYVKDAFKPHVKGYERLGTYTSAGKEKLDVLIVHLTKESKLARARTAIRNFVADHLKTHDNKDAALVAFVSPTEKQWRFSYVKMEYAAVEKDNGKVGVQTKLTPARRSSYIVGEGESCHTAQSRFLGLLQDTENHPTLAQIEDAFSVEAVTKEFFGQYKALFLDLKDELDGLAKKDKTIGAEFAAKNLNTADFAKKLMGQIVFLYFLQKKGWLGVPKGKDWGDGPHNFLRQLFDGKVVKERFFVDYKNFFHDILEPLFYDTLATDRGHDAWCSILNCRIPFLNGGLFEPLAGYDWKQAEITIPNSLFSNTETTKAGDKGTGILDVFDSYNFTVNEAEPLEKEVAIDPEMLGKVFENLLEVKERKSKGSFYTPREIVHYMCQESLINYLDTALNTDKEIVPRKDIETFIYLGEQISHYEAVAAKYPIKMPASIEKHARLIDEKLAAITVCDPAIGSGAFPVGMMQEIVRARAALTPYFNDVHDRTTYHFKRHAIQNSLYGVDIDAGAVEIAKLRLWLSLVVDEEDVKQIKPLPNLDYKIVAGNSLIGVKKDLLNQEPFKRLEELKPKFFNESDRKKKAEFKKQIDDVIHDLTNGREVFDYEIYFSEVFHAKRGFDVVIANPPYVGQKGHKEIFQEIAKTDFGKRFHQRRMDLFYFFFHLALDLMIDKGTAAFITTNYYITATYADKLRKDLRERSDILALINFNELKIFESALGQHNMISIFQKGHYSPFAFTALCQRSGIPKSQEVENVLSRKDNLTTYSVIPQAELYSSENLYIRLAGHAEHGDNPIQQILAKLASGTCALGAITKISQGIVTGADRLRTKYVERYPDSGFTLNEGVFVLTAEECRKKGISPKSSHVKPWFKNSDIGKYHTADSTPTRLLYFKDEKQKQPIDDSVLKHFKRFEHVLVDRLSVCKTNKFQWNIVSKWIARGEFYLLFYPRKPQVFDGEKIVAPQRSYNNTFGYNDTPWYASADVYFINPIDESVSLRYVLAILNSKLIFVWLYHKGKRKGEMLELYQKPLSEIPIKRISPDEQKPFIKLVDRILAAKQRDADAFTSALEREVDELVFALYGLTDEEKALVQAAAR